MNWWDFYSLLRDKDCGAHSIFLDKLLLRKYYPVLICKIGLKLAYFRLKQYNIIIKTMWL